MSLARRASISKQKVILQIVELLNQNYPRRRFSCRDAINPKSSTASVNSVSNGSQRSAESVKELLNRQYTGPGRDRFDCTACRYTCEQFREKNVKKNRDLAFHLGRDLSS